MARIIYLLYTTDIWLLRSSMKVEGAFSTKRNLQSGAAKLIKALLAEESISPMPGESQRQFIKRMLTEFMNNDFQTQSLKVNLIAKPVTLNKLE